MKNKILSIIIALVLVIPCFLLASCGNGNAKVEKMNAKELSLEASSIIYRDNRPVSTNNGLFAVSKTIEAEEEGENDVVMYGIYSAITDSMLVDFTECEFDLSTGWFYRVDEDGNKVYFARLLVDNNCYITPTDNDEDFDVFDEYGNKIFASVCDVSFFTTATHNETTYEIWFVEKFQQSESCIVLEVLKSGKKKVRAEFSSEKLLFEMEEVYPGVLLSEKLVDKLFTMVYDYYGGVVLALVNQNGTIDWSLRIEHENDSIIAIVGQSLIIQESTNLKDYSEEELLKMENVFYNPDRIQFRQVTKTRKIDIVSGKVTELTDFHYAIIEQYGWEFMTGTDYNYFYGVDLNDGLNAEDYTYTIYSDGRVEQGYFFELDNSRKVYLEPTFMIADKNGNPYKFLNGNEFYGCAGNYVMVYDQYDNILFIDSNGKVAKKLESTEAVRWYIEENNVAYYTGLVGVENCILVLKDERIFDEELGEYTGDYRTYYYALNLETLELTQVIPMSDNWNIYYQVYEYGFIAVRTLRTVEIEGVEESRYDYSLISHSGRVLVEINDQEDGTLKVDVLSRLQNGDLLATFNGKIYKINTNLPYNGLMH